MFTIQLSKVEETFETDLVMYSSDAIGSKVNYNQISYPNKQRKSLSEYYKLMIIFNKML